MGSWFGRLNLNPDGGGVLSRLRVARCERPDHIGMTVGSHVDNFPLM